MIDFYKLPSKTSFSSKKKINRYKIEQPKSKRGLDFNDNDEEEAPAPQATQANI